MHKIVFSGKLADGAEPAAVRRKVAQLFRLHDKSTLDRLFSGNPVVIRKNLDATGARKIRDALRKAGALCVVEPPLPAVKPPPPPPPPDTGGLSLVPTEEEQAQSGDSEEDSNPFAVRDLSTPPADPTAPAATRRAPASAARQAPTSTRSRTATPEQAAAVIQATQGNSSRRAGASLPADASGLSWGGFFLSWIWGIGNNTWIALLALLPIANIIVPFWLLFTGREKAWQNRRWRDVEHFNRVQRIWGASGLVIAVLVGWLWWTALSEATRQAEQIQSSLSDDNAAFEERLKEVDDPRARESLRQLREAMEEARRQQQ